METRRKRKRATLSKVPVSEVLEGESEAVVHGPQMLEVPVEPEGRPRHKGINVNSNGKRRKLTRQGTSNNNVMYQMLRRSFNMLTSKMNTLTEEVRIIKTSGIEANSDRLEIGGADQTQIDNLSSGTTVRIEEPSSVEIAEKTSTQIKPKLSEQEYRHVTYNIRNLNIEKPKFGDKSDMQPMTFLEDLESYLRKTSKDGNELDIITECLVGNARDWARIYKERWTGFEDFKSDFLATFWGDKDQSELRRSIVQGTWNRNKSQSMLSHFLQITGKAQMLSFKIPEKQLIADVIRHYPRSIQQSWVTAKLETIIGTAEFLKSMDDISMQEPHVYYNEGKTKDVETRKKEYQRYFNKWQPPQNQKHNTGGARQKEANEITTAALETTSINEVLN